MNKNIKTKDNIITLFAWLALATVFICDMIFLAQNVRFHTNSDLASEMILARLLRNEHRWITNSWYYSTELRVIAIAPIYAIAFIFSDNWQTVRILGAVLMYVILIVSCIYTCYGFGDKAKKVAPLCAAIMMLPLSIEWRHMLLTGMYYAPQVALSFISFGLFIRYPDIKDKGKKAKSLIFQGIIAFLSGLGGLRMILMLYIPLMIVGFLNFKRNKKIFFESLICMIFTGLGYSINLIFKITDTITYSTYLRTRPAVPSFSQILKVFGDILENFGFVFRIPNGIEDIAGDILAFTILLMLVLSLIKFFSKKNISENIFSIRFTILMEYIMIVFVIFILIYSVTDMNYEGRYNIHFIVYFVLLLTVMLSECDASIIFAFFLLGILSSLSSYSTFSGASNEYIKYSELVQYIESKKIEKGYASFWNSNVLTDISGGDIEMWSLEGDTTRRYNSTTHDGIIFPFDGEDVVIGQWLQLTEHERVLPDLPVFVIVSDEEYDKYIINKEYYDEHFEKQLGNLRLYIFD